jgi:hypothetical protein
MDYTLYSGLIASIIVSAAYATLSWKLSGEQFSETKYFRTILISIACALGLTVSGAPLDSVYVSPFASTLVGVVGSKALNKAKTVPVEQKQAVEELIQATLNTAALSPSPSPSPSSSPSSLSEAVQPVNSQASDTPTMVEPDSKLEGNVDDVAGEVYITPPDTESDTGTV